MPTLPAGPTDTPPDGNITDMRIRALHWLLMQGLGVVVMAVWLWIQQGEIKALRTESKDCQTEMVSIQQTQNEKLIQALKELNSTMEDIKNQKSRR